MEIEKTLLGLVKFKPIQPIQTKPIQKFGSRKVILLDFCKVKKKLCSKFYVLLLILISFFFTLQKSSKISFLDPKI